MAGFRKNLERFKREDWSDLMETMLSITRHLTLTAKCKTVKLWISHKPFHTLLKKDLAKLYLSDDVLFIVGDDALRNAEIFALGD